MKILVSILRFPPDFTGAGQRIEKFYSRMLENKSAESVSVFTTSPQKKPDYIEKRGGMEIFFIGKNSYQSCSGGSRLLKSFFVLRSSLSVVLRYLSTRQKIELVHTVDSSWLSTLVGWLAFFSRKPLVKEIVLIGTDDPAEIKKEKGRLAWIFLFPFRYAKLIITISRQLKQICVSHGFEEEKIWTRHNPVYMEKVGTDEIAGFTLPSSSIASKNILFVGAVTPRKNIEFLLRAGFFLKGRVNLFFAGPVEDSDYFRELLRISRELDKSTQGRINPVFLGWIKDRKKISLMFKKSEVFWFASNYEGLGNVVIEALMSGTPVVTLRVNGIMDDLIRSKDEGTVVLQDSPEELAGAANYYLYDYSVDREALSEKSRARFDPQKIEAGYIKRFREVLC